MSSLVVLRAGELIDSAHAMAFGVNESVAVRVVVRVMRARAIRFGMSRKFPDAAILYVPRADYERFQPFLGTAALELAARVSARLDPDNPVPVRLTVRAHTAGSRQVWACAPILRNQVKPVRHSAPTRPYEEPLWLHSALLPAPVEVPPVGLVIGRGGRSAVRLDDPRVSRRHVRVTPLNGSELQCEDLGSRNGTWIDGVRQAEVASLRVGQQLRVGDTAFQVVRRVRDGKRI